MSIRDLASRLRDTAGQLPPGPVPLAARWPKRMAAPGRPACWSAGGALPAAHPGRGQPCLSLGLALLGLTLWWQAHRADLPPRLGRLSLPREGASRAA